MNKVIKFSASWCGPCKAMAPQFEKFQQAHQEDGVEIVDVDIDQDFELASQYQVRSIPHTVFIKEGEVVDRIAGIANFEKLNLTYNRSFLSAST